MYPIRRKPLLIASCLALTGLAPASDESLDVHADYYRGFAHGAYYGLMLAGVEYDVAWCMKAELEYEAAGMGTGADFQPSKIGSTQRVGTINGCHVDDVMRITIRAMSKQVLRLAPDTQVGITRSRIGSEGDANSRLQHFSDGMSTVLKKCVRTRAVHN